MGFDTFNVGPELEYFLFKDNKGTETLDEGGYFAMTALDAATELRNETIQALEAVGIPIEYHHHEVAPSQHEIDMRYAPALDMADHTITYRLIVKEVAAKNGVYATFMPKPLFGENGSGMHTHMSLFKDGRNQFFDGERPVPPLADGEGSSSPACSATPASSRRCSRSGSTRTSGSCPGYEAPVYVAWSQRNRSALDPDPALQAGLGAGDARRDPLPRPGLQPVPDLRARCCTRASRGSRRATSSTAPMEHEPLPPHRPRSGDERGIVSLPETLGEAVDELAGSELMRRALGDHIFDELREAQAARSGTSTASSSRSGSSTAIWQFCRRERRKSA